MTTTRQLGPDALLTFNQQLRGITLAGIPLDAGLQNVARGIAKGRLSGEVESVVAQIRQGASLSEALRASGAFPESYVNVIAAGEEAGTLTALLEQMVRHYRRQCAFRSAFITIISYPIGIMIPAVCILLFIMIFIMPKFVEIFLQLGAELPPLTVLIMDISYFVIQYKLILLAIAIAGIGYLIHWWRTGDITTRDWLFLRRLPLLSTLYRNIISASFLSVMGMLTEHGVTLVPALRLCRATLISRNARREIDYVCQRLEQGEDPGNALGSLTFLPHVTATMLRLGAEREDLGRLMQESAELYESEVEALQMRAVTILEPLMIVALGSILGTCIISLYLPLFTLPSMIK